MVWNKLSSCQYKLSMVIMMTLEGLAYKKVLLSTSVYFMQSSQEL